MYYIIVLKIYLEGWFLIKLEEIFGNKSEIKISDIDDIKNSGILHENHEIELTDIDDYISAKSKTKRKKQRKNQNIKIISELISFLNSGRGVGLLFLGLAEINGEILNKGVKTLKNKEQIRSIIIDNIKSIPSTTKSFKLDIIPVDYNDNKIFIVEVENTDLDCIFYSRIENIAYERQGDQCKSISLPDFLEIIAKKNHARLFALFKNESDEKSYILTILLSNIGLEPGMNVTTKISTASNQKIEHSCKYLVKSREHITEIKNKKILYDGKITHEISDETVNWLMFKSHGENSIQIIGEKIYYCILFGNAGTPPQSDLVYPGMNHILGDLILEKKDFQMVISIETYEIRGRTQQEFSLTSKDNEIRILETYRNFKPYLTI